VVLLFTAGCGYHVAGRGDLVPKNIKTIAVPAFQNVTTRYQLARMLPEDINSWYVSNKSGQMVPFSAFATARWQYGSPRLERYNGLPSVEILGQAGYLTRGSPAAVIAGRLEMYARSMIILTFGGGTNEIQRDLIAIFGLGMPRSLR